MTWETRDLPVLRAIVEITDEGGWHIEPEHVAERTGLDVETVGRAFNALAAEQPPFFEFLDGTTFGSRAREIIDVFNPTGHARRTVGTWPTAESLADRIVSGLEAAAEAEEDEDKRGGIRRIAAWFGGAGRDILVDVASGVVTKSAGFG